VGGDEGEEAMKVHRLREDLTHLREVNRALYSLLTDKSSPAPHKTVSLQLPSRQE
jgi:hypothetical protein